MEVLKEILEIEKFQPAYYLYLGRYLDDRDLKVLGWFGPYGSAKEALESVPNWWEWCGYEKPRVKYRFFEPRGTRIMI